MISGSVDAYTSTVQNTLLFSLRSHICGHPDPLQFPNAIMRTRFLNIDFLSSSSIETLSFLHLPIPHLHSPSASDEHLLLPSHPLPQTFPHIHAFPIDTALSKFISDATPQILHADYAAARQATFCSGSDDIRFSQKDNGTAADGEHGCRFEVIQYEEPELYPFLENACFLQEQNQVFYYVSEIENDKDLLQSGLENIDKVHETVYLVEAVMSECDPDKKAYTLEDDSSVQKLAQFCHRTFPLFEADETCLGSFTKPQMEDIFLLCLQNIESQLAENNNILDVIELLSSVQYDLWEFLSNRCLSRLSFESQLASLDMLLGIDIINMMESLPSEEGSEDSFLLTYPVVFQEFKFLPADLLQSYEVFFEMQIAEETESSNWMFSQDMNFKNFEELIVCCELALVDDTFKSLPVPVLYEYIKVSSVYATVEEVLLELKHQPLSASYGIYLDWHLLDENKFSSKICSSTQSVLDEVGPHQIDFYWEHLDTERLVHDFVLSDVDINEPKMEDHKEPFQMLPQISDDNQLTRVASSNFFNDKGPKPENLEKVVQADSKEASLLFKSVSMFNDLDFFLNPREGVSRQKGKCAVEEPSTDVSVSMGGKSHSFLAPDGNVCKEKLVEMLNIIPVGNKHFAKSSGAAVEVEDSFIPISVPYSADSMKNEKIQEAMVSFPETIIIMNTQNFDKEMIVSRRNTYQRILAMEKEGTQIVERDLSIPVDIIISSAVCVLWYDCTNIRKKASVADNALSFLPLWIENIATNVLTSLSLTFSSCLLIFEGDISFLSIIMESSDGLYAAAASLGIDLQILCSYSSELTNEVMLSSISYGRNLCRGIYPKMHESETLAEFFLTKFPSINSLTAHAVLSCGVRLIDFLEWSHERRTLAVRKYRVSDESLSLFSALCRYGEREDSKSVMTDCSSSASSCPDSDRSQINTDCARKRQKRIHTLQNVNGRADDVWECEPLEEFSNGVKGTSGFSKQYDPWTWTDPETHDPPQWSCSFPEDLYCQKQENVAHVMELSPPMKPYTFQNPKGLPSLDEIQKASLDINDKLLAQEGASEMTVKNKYGMTDACESEILRSDIIGEVVDHANDYLWKRDISSAGNSTFFSPLLPTTDNATTKAKAVRRLSFGTRGSMPTAAKNTTSGIWNGIEDDKNALLENYGHHNKHRDQMPVKHQRNLLEAILQPGSAGNAKGSPFKEEILHYNRTPLYKAVHSGRPQPGSPWTMEFLNRIREKSRPTEQALPCDVSTPPSEKLGNKSRPVKRRSPSILEFFRYQGGTIGKIHGQKKQKQPVQLSGSQNGRTSASIIPTWTPFDKRAKQTLSFEINDGEAQTRLVWSDGAHHLRKKFRKK